MGTNKEIARIIGINLKRLAYEHGRTQSDISRDLKINKQTLSTWMNGQRIPRMEKVDQLCHYFNCKRTDILDPYEPKNTEDVTAFERNIILAYRDATTDRKDAAPKPLFLRHFGAKMDHRGFEHLRPCLIVPIL